MANHLMHNAHATIQIESVMPHGQKVPLHGIVQTCSRNNKNNDDDSHVDCAWHLHRKLQIFPNLLGKSALKNHSLRPKAKGTEFSWCCLKQVCKTVKVANPSRRRTQCEIKQGPIEMAKSVMSDEKMVKRCQTLQNDVKRCFSP